MKARQRYKSLAGSIFEITNIDASGIVMQNIKSKKLFKYSLVEFKQAITDNKISLLTYNSKSNKFEQTEFIANYLEERNKILDAESNDKTIVS